MVALTAASPSSGGCTLTPYQRILPSRFRSSSPAYVSIEEISGSGGVWGGQGGNQMGPGRLQTSPHRERAAHRAPRFGVVGGAVGVADVVAADRPGAEPDLADRETGAPQQALLHRSSSASAAGAATGREQVVPTQTVAAGRSPGRRT